MPERFLPFEVRIEHDHEHGTKRVTLIAEREVVGTAAPTHIPETNSTVPVTPGPDDWPIIYQEPNEAGLHRGQKTIAAFDGSSNMHITTDFDTPEAANGPTWATTDLTGLTPALSGNFLSMVGDPFSPKYLGTGTTVNGWILTSTGIYSITDVFGVSGGPTLALQHTLATANANYGFLASSFGVLNWAVAVVNYVNSTGTKCVYTTDGGSSWTESTITAFYATAVTFGAPHCPPVFMSPFTPGLVYAGAFTSTTGLPPGALYKSTDYGATWSAASSPSTSFGNYNGGTFNIPFDDNTGQLLCYWGQNGASPALYRTEADGTTTTNITPSGGNWGAVFGFWQLSVCPIDRQRIAFAAWDPKGAGGADDTFAIHVSKDGGTTWTKATTDRLNANGYTGVGISGTDPDVIYAWGYGLTIAYSQDFGLTWEDKSGNLGSSGTVFVLLGG